MHFATPHATIGPATASSLILVTPDGERTMNTFLGACVHLAPADIDEAVVAAAKVTYLEGYLWDPPLAKEAFKKAARIAAPGRPARFASRFPIPSASTAIATASSISSATTSTSSSPMRRRSTRSIRSMTSTTALQRVRKDCEIAALTRSEAGCVVVKGDEIHVVEAHPVEKVVDATGAGDLFASGFLYGFTRDLPLAHCARLGALAAAEVISHVGARPQISLNAHAKANDRACFA